jgi:hypothetical protein
LETRGKLLIIKAADSEEREQAKEGSMLHEISTEKGPTLYEVMERGQG